VINWIRRVLGLDWPGQIDASIQDLEEELREKVGEINRQLDIVERWVGNLDAAIYRIEQAGRAAGVMAEPEPALADLKALSESIRAEVARKKAEWPARVEDL
jgi:hypothetical protein